MEHRCDVVVEIAIADPLQKLVLVEVVGDVAIGEVAELVAMRQIVDGDDVPSPRAFSALTRLDPMNPAAPVTTMYTTYPPLRSRTTNGTRGATAQSNS